MNVNLWVLLSATATALIRTRLEWDEEQRGEYKGSIGRVENSIFNTMADFANVARMFKQPTFTGRKQHLFTLNFTSEAEAVKALDNIETNHAGQSIIGGAWFWDGRQLGTEWVLNEGGERTGDTVGVPTYQLHARLLDFMPDTIKRSNTGNVISTTPATVLTDVNLIQGQKERRFD